VKYCITSDKVFKRYCEKREQYGMCQKFVPNARKCAGILVTTLHYRHNKQVIK
jgi:hypothetical protein